MKRPRTNRWRRTITPEIVGAVLDLQHGESLLYAVFAPVASTMPKAAPKPEAWPKPKRSTALPPPAVKPKKADVMLRAKADKEARALEQPVDALPGMKPERFVHAAPAQAAPIIAAVINKAIIAERVSPKFTAPPNPVEARRLCLQRAIDWLNAHAWFVQVVNREALVRTYRVAGKRDAMLAEDVIRVATEKGMQP